MSAGAIGGIVASQTPTRNENNAFAELSSTEFIKILITELTTQDPFEPNDSAAILDQLSSLRNIESQLSLQKQFQSLVDQNALTSASGLIGQLVKGVNTDNQSVEGIVQSMVIENGKPIFKLTDGKRLEADRVTDIGNLGDLDTQIVQQLLRNLIILNSSALVGKKVSGLNEAGVPVSGVVTSVRSEDDDLILELDNGKELSAGAVTKFSEVSEEAPEEVIEEVPKEDGI